MKKAKLYWIIYFILVGVVALFFTLFVNQGLGGMFSVRNEQGNVEQFRAYLFFDYNRFDSEQKAELAKKLANFDQVSKIKIDYLNAIDKTKKIDSLMAQADKNPEAKTLAAEIKKELQKPDLSNNAAFDAQKTKLKSIINAYETNKTKFENEFAKVKLPVDKSRIEFILSSIALAKVKSNNEIPADRINMVPKTTMDFFVINQNIEKNIPESLKNEIIPEFNDALISELSNLTEETINENITKARKEKKEALDKVIKTGETDELIEKIKASQTTIDNLTTQLNRKKMLNTIVSNYTNTIDKCVSLMKEYVDEIVTIITTEGMPFQNFLTQGLYLGKYSRDFTIVGEIVKEQFEKNIYPLAGVHKIEERLFGGRSSISNIISRKIYGVGEVLAFRLAESQLDHFVNGFTALYQNVKFQLEQSAGTIYQTQGTSGGGGEETPQPDSSQQPQADNSAQNTGALTVDEMKLVVKLYSELSKMYLPLKPFFAAVGQATISTSDIKNADKVLTRIYSFLKNLNEKYPKIVNQTTIDTSETGGGRSINIKEQYDISFTKLADVRDFIQKRMARLTSITSSGKTIKILLILIIGLIGAGIGFLTLKWDKEESQQKA